MTVKIYIGSVECHIVLCRLLIDIKCAYCFKITKVVIFHHICMYRLSFILMCTHKHITITGKWKKMCYKQSRAHHVFFKVYFWYTNHMQRVLLFLFMWLSWVAYTCLQFKRKLKIFREFIDLKKKKHEKNHFLDI